MNLQSWALSQMFFISKHLLKLTPITFTCPHHLQQCLNMAGVQSFTHSLKKKERKEERKDKEDRRKREKEGKKALRERTKGRKDQLIKLVH